MGIVPSPESGGLLLPPLIPIPPDFLFFFPNKISIPSPYTQLSPSVPFPVPSCTLQFFSSFELPFFFNPKLLPSWAFKLLLTRRYSRFSREIRSPEPHSMIHAFLDYRRDHRLH